MQLVRQTIHNRGHTLDLDITDKEEFIDGINISCDIQSDHYCIISDFMLDKCEINSNPVNVK